MGATDRPIQQMQVCSGYRVPAKGLGPGSWIIGLFLASAALCVANPFPGEEADLSVVTGTFPCFPQGRLNYSGDGVIAVKGEDRDDCGFVVKSLQIRPKLPGRGAAPSTPAFLRAKQSGSTTVAVLVGSIVDSSMVEVKLAVPSSLAETIISTRRGDVRAANLRGAAWLETGAGAVEAGGIAGNVMVKTGGGPIEVGRIGGKLRCVSGGGTIRVQNAGSDAECESSGGEIVIDEVRGVARAITAGGNIRIGRAFSTVIAESISGFIEVAEAAGQVTARTRGGMIEVGSSKGCTCEAVRGGIRVKSGDGPLLVNAGSGHIVAMLAEGVFRSDSLLRSVSGDITIVIPSNLSVSVQARNETKGFGGRIVSEFSEIRVEPNSPGVAAEGVLNGGGPLLRVVAAGGNIYLRRQR